MKAGESTLRALLEGKRQFRIPVFQRTFAWKPKHREQLWDDITALYTQRTAGDWQAQHFIASIVVQKQDLGAHRAESLVVIDGQQRLTTASALLAALRDAARDAGNEPLAQEIEDEFLLNRNARESVDRAKLNPSPLDRDEWMAILDGGPLPASRSPELRKTYDEFRARIGRGDLAVEQPFDLEELLAAVVSGLSIVLITLASDDNVYRIFESLNFKGLTLSQVDLIRNLFMMKLPADDAEAIYTELWRPMEERLPGRSLQQFAHDYYLRSGEFLREDAMYVHAKSVLDRLDTPVDIREELRLMGWYATVWRAVDGQATDGVMSAEITESLTWLHRFGAQTPWPFLLMLLASYKKDDAPGDAGLRPVDSEGVLGVIRLVESFLVRRMLCGVPTNALNRLFIALWRQLGPGDIVEAAREQLASRRFPSDTEFRQAVRDYPLYTDSRPGQARLVIDRLALRVQGREAVDLANPKISVEHIVPQTLTPAWEAALGSDAARIHAQWLHTLPNLTLTAYNSEMSNNPWQVPGDDDPRRSKRPRYAESNIVMTRHLAVHPDFGEPRLSARASELAELAVDIWPGP